MGTERPPDAATETNKHKKLHDGHPSTSGRVCKSASWRRNELKHAGSGRDSPPPPPPDPPTCPRISRCDWVNNFCGGGEDAEVVFPPTSPEASGGWGCGGSGCWGQRACGQCAGSWAAGSPGSSAAAGSGPVGPSRCPTGGERCRWARSEWRAAASGRTWTHLGEGQRGSRVKALAALMGTRSKVSGCIMIYYLIKMIKVCVGFTRDI